MSPSIAYLANKSFNSFSLFFLFDPYLLNSIRVVMAPIFPNEEDTSQCLFYRKKIHGLCLGDLRVRLLTHQASTHWQEKLWKNVEDCHRCL